TVFKLDVTGKKSVLHNFIEIDGWPTDGYWPQDLRGDSAGNLYGVTYGGGASFGVVFKIDPNGIFTVLSDLPAGPTNGWGPTGALAKDSNGNLYGVTLYGGDLTCDADYGCGVVFKVDT